MEATIWRQCVACKKPIHLGQKYYACSVTSCNPKYSPTQFCSFECWAVHNEVYRHRNAAAVEETAPSKMDSTPPSHAASQAKPGAVASPRAQTAERDVLVVVSKIKKYIHEESGMNASADLMESLTDVLVRYCDAAIKNAQASGRKTVMARDVPK